MATTFDFITFFSPRLLKATSIISWPPPQPFSLSCRFLYSSAVFAYLDIIAVLKIPLYFSSMHALERITSIVIIKPYTTLLFTESPSNVKFSDGMLLYSSLIYSLGI